MTSEEARRRAKAAARAEDSERAKRQRAFLSQLAARLDVAVLRSGEMWR